MSIICVGDIHAKRKEPFKLAVTNFFDWLVENYKDETIVFLGDFFDSQPHNSLRLEVANYLKEFKQVFILKGNHDISRKMGVATLYLDTLENVIIYENATRTRVENMSCMFINYSHNPQEEYSSIKCSGLDVVFSHLTHPKEEFGEEGFDLSYIESKLYVYGHTHCINQYDNHIILGVPAPTRHGEQNQKHRIMKITSPTDYEFIDVPQYFTYETIEYGEFPENPNNILTVENSPSYDSVHEKYKKYHVRKINLQSEENIEMLVNMDLNKNSIKSEFVEYSKLKEHSKDIANCCLGYLDNIKGD